MNSKTQSSLVSQPSWLASSKPIAWVIVPILSAIAIIVGLSIDDAMSEHRFEARIRHLRAQRIPVDYESLDALRRENAHSEGAVDWSEIFTVQNALALSTRDWPTFASDTKMGGRLIPGGEWPAEKQTARYLEKLRPLFIDVERALEQRMPILQTRDLEYSFRDGFNGLNKNLRIEVEHALYHRQAERAIKALELMHGLEILQRANEKAGYLISTFQSEFAVYSSISRSLTTKLLEETTIRALSKRLEEDPELSQHWRMNLVRHRVDTLETIQGPPRQLLAELGLLHGDQISSLFRRFIVPNKILSGSAKNRLLDFYDESETIADGGYAQLQSRALTLDEKFFNNRFINFKANFLLRAQNLSWNRLANEDARRLVRTALAIKLFEIAQQRWPKELSELSEIGHPQGEWSTLRKGNFGYEIDGEWAAVWSVRPGKPSSYHARSIAPNLQSIGAPIEDLSPTEFIWIR